ncbi:hypothetical protein [Chryseobacterium sp. ON_d1]|uniref:hypothetical protein n=1 Tax=Chryseobacterium sp. ON_d1 TaxID=2583211 RepID=UPI00115AE35E|nr:hypothetical protein [Chryseobacterium sp. ON_d1]GEJ43577.1 hypothetical protein CRS_01850 [Chryseobacterium sp. ON_d1]
MLNTQRRNSTFTVFFALFFLQFCHAQNQSVKSFFENKKKNSYKHCIQESGISTIKNTNENKTYIELVINGCNHEGGIFNNFIDGTSTLLALLPSTEDITIFNWKKYDTYIPAPTVTIMQTDKLSVVEFTYYDEEKNAYDIPLKRKVYEENEGKFKNELMYAKSKLSGTKIDNDLLRYERNDYYIIKRLKGKYTFFTIVDGQVKMVK